MNDGWDSADIDRAKADLLAAGWIPKTSTIWKSPSGSLHTGPAGAWKTMKKAQNDAAVDPQAHSTGKPSTRDASSSSSQSSPVGAPPAPPQWHPPSLALRLLPELRAYLDTLTITDDTIGDIRRECFVPWDSAWNGIVRDETAQRERKTT